MTAAKAGVPARRAALGLLTAVLMRGRSLDDALEHEPRVAALPPTDRAFARMLVGTTLRRLGQIDGVIRPLLRHPRRLDARLHCLLRLGTAQLLFLDTPPHAAVDSTVACLGPRSAEQQRGFVNAVLRRISCDGSAMLAALPGGMALNIPAWLLTRWRSNFGDAIAGAIAEASLAEPATDVTAKEDQAGWAERLDAVPLPNGSMRCRRAGAITDWPGYGDGAWWVQDAAAALPARLLAAEPGALVFDLCAAPGGKTAQLAAAGARVVAVDRSARRLDRLQANLQRLGLAAQVVASDVATWEPETVADAVLLDAPCTATGTIRRHPDLLHHKRESDLVPLTAVQTQLLERASTLVRVGGTLVYATCSLEPEEGEAIVDAALANAPHRLNRVPVTAAEVPDLEAAITPVGDVRTLPGVHWADRGGLDGFFISRLRRVA